MAITRGHKTLGARWLFKLRNSHQSSLYLDSEVAPKSPTFHTATVGRHVNRQTIVSCNYIRFIIYSNTLSKTKPKKILIFIKV